MTGLWMLTAAVCAAEAIWLKQWRPVRAPSDLAPAGRVRELPLPLVLEMLSVAIRQGASTSRALIAVGDIAAGGSATVRFERGTDFVTVTVQCPVVPDPTGVLPTRVTGKATRYF